MCIDQKMGCIHGDCGKFAGVVPRQDNERHHIANLKIEGSADVMEYFRKPRASGNRLKQMFFCPQGILDLIVKTALYVAFLWRGGPRSDQTKPVVSTPHCGSGLFVRAPSVHARGL